MIEVGSQIRTGFGIITVIGGNLKLEAELLRGSCEYLTVNGLTCISKLRTGMKMLIEDNTYCVCRGLGRNVAPELLLLAPL
jgi:hypothetical protein